MSGVGHCPDIVPILAKSLSPGAARKSEVWEKPEAGGGTAAAAGRVRSPARWGAARGCRHPAAPAPAPRDAANGAAAARSEAAAVVAADVTAGCARGAGRGAGSGHRLAATTRRGGGDDGGPP